MGIGGAGLLWRRRCHRVYAVVVSSVGLITRDGRHPTSRIGTAGACAALCPPQVGGRPPERRLGEALTPAVRSSSFHCATAGRRKLPTASS